MADEPETIIICSTSIALGRSMSFVTTTMHQGKKVTCPCTLLIAGNSATDDLERCYQTWSRMRGNMATALEALGVTQVDIVILEVRDSAGR